MKLKKLLNVRVCVRAHVPTSAQVLCRKQGKTESFIAVF